MKKTPSGNTEEFINGLKAKQIDLLVKRIPFYEGSAFLCYIGQLVDRNILSDLVIKPLLIYSAEKRRLLTAETSISLIYADQSMICDDLNDVENRILKGAAVLLFTGDPRYIVINCKNTESRSVSTPEMMYANRGPRESFVEDLDKNLSLLRKRLKDSSLRIQNKEIGRRTKTAVVLVYLEDIANSSVIQEISKRIDAINVDGIYETGELQHFLLNKKTNLFPQMGLLERPDQATEKLLEGKVIILVDGSCVALDAPIAMAELLYASDDRYDNKFFGLFMRVIRYMALFITLTATSYYIAVSEFHPDALPASYIVTFAQMRARAPFSAFIAVLSIETIVELMREALLRVPVKIGSAIGIVGAIIIGQAASTSGIYSPLLLIIVSIGFLSSFALPDITLSNPMRVLKFFIIMATGFFGFFGFGLAITTILMLVVSNDSFGVPYLAPWAPYNSYDFRRTLFFSRRDSPKRQNYMRTKDNTRAPTPDKGKKT